jgi:hypothetical protein
MNKMSLVANFETDLQVAISLLKLNRGIKDASEARRVGNVFVCDILTPLDKKNVQGLISSRFGRAIQVR